MTTRQRKPAVVEEAAVEETPQYNLEPLDGDARSELNVWGNATQIAAQKLRKTHPGWASMLDDVFAVVGLAIQENK